jgi:D-alanine--poly(phosphoribitol) ligase subunit 1
MEDKFYSLILDRIIDCARKNSNRNAFFIEGRGYTYSQFLSEIEFVSRLLQMYGGESRIVALVANNDITTYASIVALWACGRAYMPINSSEPLQRAGQMIDILKIDTILDSSQENKFSSLCGNVIHTSQTGRDDMVNISQTARIFDSTSQSEEGNVPVVPGNIIYEGGVDDSREAYVIFTSGSTGVPKAVPITRRNLLQMFYAFEREGYSFSNEDKVLQCNDLTFDLSVIAYLLPMMTGACCYTVPGNVIKYLYIYDLFEEQNLTIAMIGPSTILSLKPYFDEFEVPSLRYCYVIGEKLPVNVLSDWQKCIPNASIENYYGPTEATVWCTYYKYYTGHDKSYNGALSIGKPLYGVVTMIVGDNNDEVPDGTHGELCLQGAQVTNGYVGDDELNAHAFFCHEGKEYYKTGDICFVDEEGDLMFVGRKDSQIKVHGGLRIEIGEVEYRAQALLGMNVIVIPYTDSSQMTELAMFIEHRPMLQKEVLDRLSERLSSSMMPAKLIFIEKFPLNKNGKIDRKLLFTYI